MQRHMSPARRRRLEAERRRIQQSMSPGRTDRLMDNILEQRTAVQTDSPKASAERRRAILEESKKVT